MTKSPTDFAGLLECLVRGDVHFIIVGGLAGIIHGAARATFDVNVVYRRSSKNIDKLVHALGPLRPYLRGRLPACRSLDRDTVSRGLNFTLETTRGDLDLLGEIVGGGPYDDLVADAQVVEVFGLQCRTVSLNMLVRLKRAAGRPKDLEAIAELEALRDEQS